MVRFSSAALLLLVSAIGTTAHAGNGGPQDSRIFAPIAEAAPTLAPFQHVRFCLHYPSDCKSDPTENDRIDLNADTSALLNRVNRDVNLAIGPIVKSYGSDLQDGWTISPVMGDCNDYAVTKRHQLIQLGLPAKALRLSVVKTASGVGHLVLVVVTTKGDIVLDNLNESIRPWQQTDYHWLKIQSAADARYWYEVKASGSSVAQSDRRVRLADR